MHPATRWSQLVAVGNEAANARVFFLFYRVVGGWHADRRIIGFGAQLPALKDSPSHTHTRTHRHTHTTRTKRTKSNLPQELLIEVQMDSASSPMNPLWLCPVERLQKEEGNVLFHRLFQARRTIHFPLFFFAETQQNTSALNTWTFLRGPRIKATFYEPNPQKHRGLSRWDGQ